MTRFYLVRHGETEWNANGRWQGHIDVPLNDIGREQGRLVARRLRELGEPFAAIYSSDLLRAWETAQFIAQALNMPILPEPALREIDLGWWGGLTRAEIAKRDPETLVRLDAGEDLPRGGAESLIDLYYRASAALERIADAHPDDQVIIVTHGGTARALLGHAYGNGAAIWPWPYASIGNTALSVIEQTPDGWRVKTVNDMSHLQDAPQALDVMAITPDDAQQA